MNIKKGMDIIKYLKEKEGLKIYDTHVHPLDVMGVCQPQVNVSKHLGYKDIGKKDLVELLNFGATANILLRCTCNIFPFLVRSAISEKYQNNTQERLFHEMDEIGVDSAVLVPISPQVNVDHISKFFTNPRFVNLGSLDIQTIQVDEISSEITRQVINFGIKGLKLHPNLQGFFPQPSMNIPEMKEKLLRLYETVSKHKLYLLFHGGYTNLFFTGKILSKYYYEKQTNALLENFINLDGSSEILGKYSIPIVIAHLGNYARIRRDLYNLKRIVSRYSDVFFDTSGANPNVIKWFISSFGCTKLLFGSDTFYHGMKTNFHHCIVAILKARSNEDISLRLENILGRNFSTQVLLS